MSDAPSYPIGTKEYVKAEVTSDRSLSAQVVEVKVGVLDAWRPGTWVGSAGLTRTVSTTSVVDFASYTKGAYTVFVRFTDTPEIPIIDAGRIFVTSV
jgi:hypothetical protein